MMAFPRGVSITPPTTPSFGPHVRIGRRFFGATIVG